MKDIIIIGGGIGGLYTALKCSELGFNVILIEKSARLGGHIYTSKMNNISIETGAGRFNSNHVLLLKLINRYDLNIYELVGNKMYIPVLNERCKNSEVNVYDMIKKVIKYSAKISEELQKKITFSQLCEMVLGFEDTKILIEAFGYNAEFLITNAYVSLKTFSEDFTNKYKYYGCVEGFSTLVEKIEKDLSEKSNVKIYKDTLITSYAKNKDDTYILETSNSKFKANYLIFALPKHALLEIPLFNNYAKALFDTVLPISLNRIYAQYAKPWFKDISKFTTDLQLRQFIPINKENGIVMVSYSDLYDADYWKVYADQGNEILEKQIHRQLKTIFPKKVIPHAVKIESYYWKNGTHTWIPGVDPLEVCKELQNLFPNVAIVGEAYSMRQGWIEGALESVESILPKLYKATGGGNYKSWFQKRKMISKEILEDEFKRLYPDVKWVLISLDGENKKRIVNVTEWMFNHPGGAQYFIDNMYKDITKLFTHNAMHYNNSILKDHVMKNVQKYTIGYVTV